MPFRSGNRLRLVNLITNIITTYAFTGTPGSEGDDGPATSATVNLLRGGWEDSNGIIYINDCNSARLRKIENTAPYFIRALAGTGVASAQSTLLNGDFGPSTSATFNTPWQVWCDSLNTLYLADWGNNKIRTIDLSTGANNVRTFAGNGNATQIEANSGE